jgi:hypothetical protein
LQHYIYLQ